MHYYAWQRVPCVSTVTGEAYAYITNTIVAFGRLHRPTCARTFVDSAVDGRSRSRCLQHPGEYSVFATWGQDSHERNRCRRRSERGPLPGRYSVWGEPEPEYQHSRRPAAEQFGRRNWRS